jgi:hypothetical protein
MKSSTFWDIRPRSPLKVNRCFGGISPPTSELEIKLYVLPIHAGFLFRLPFNL